jgi:hypothetical protein
MASILRKFNKKKARTGELGEYVHDTFKDWLGIIENNYHRKWAYFLRLYWGYRPPSRIDPYRANVNVPLVYWVVDTELPRHMQALFATDPPFHARPDTRSIENELKGEIAENLIARNWMRTHRRRAAEMAALDSLLWGVGFEKGAWEIELAANGLPYKDRPEWRRTSPLDLVWDPTKPRFEDTPLIQWRILRRSDVEDMIDAGAPLKKDSLPGLGLSAAEKGYTIDDIYSSLGMAGPLFKDRYRSNIHNDEDPWLVWLEWWDDDYTCIIDYFSKKVMLEQRDNIIHEKPFTCWQFKPHGDFLVGHSMVETLASLQESINAYEGAYQDNAVLSVHRMRVFDKTTGLKMEDFIPGPDKSIPVDLPPNKSIKDVIMNFEQPQMGNEGRELQSRVIDYTERAAGQSVLSVGASAQRQDTYGGQALQISESRMRYFLENERWGQDCIARSARIDFLMHKHLMEEYVQVPVEGRYVPLELVESQFLVEARDSNNMPQIQIGPSFFTTLAANSFDFVPTGSSGLAVREYVQQQITGLIQNLMADPWIGAQPAQDAIIEAVQLQMELRLREVAASEVPGKDKLVSLIRGAYQGYINRMTMMQQPQMPQQPGPEAMPMQEMAPQGSEMFEAGETQAAPPAAPPDPGMVQ